MSEINILNLTSEERDRAYQKYKLIEAYLNNNCSLKSISKKSSVPLRTLSSWVEKYKRGTLNTQLRHMRIFFSIINRCQKVQHFSWPIIQFPFNFFEHHFVNIIKFCSFWYVLSY